MRALGYMLGLVLLVAFNVTATYFVSGTSETAGWIVALGWSPLSGAVYGCWAVNEWTATR